MDIPVNMQSLVDENTVSSESIQKNRIADAFVSKMYEEGVRLGYGSYDKDSLYAPWVDKRPFVSYISFIDSVSVYTIKDILSESLDILSNKSKYDEKEIKRAKDIVSYINENEKLFKSLPNDTLCITTKYNCGLYPHELEPRELIKEEYYKNKGLLGWIYTNIYETDKAYKKRMKEASKNDKTNYNYYLRILDIRLSDLIPEIDKTIRNEVKSKTLHDLVNRDYIYDYIHREVNVVTNKDVNLALDLQVFTHVDYKFNKYNLTKWKRPLVMLSVSKRGEVYTKEIGSASFKPLSRLARMWDENSGILFKILKFIGIVLAAIGVVILGFTILILICLFGEAMG